MKTILFILNNETLFLSWIRASGADKSSKPQSGQETPLNTHGGGARSDGHLQRATLQASFLFLLPSLAFKSKANQNPKPPAAAQQLGPYFRTLMASSLSGRKKL